MCACVFIFMLIDFFRAVLGLQKGWIESTKRSHFLPPSTNFSIINVLHLCGTFVKLMNQYWYIVINYSP